MCRGPSCGAWQNWRRQESLWLVINRENRSPYFLLFWWYRATWCGRIFLNSWGDLRVRGLALEIEDNIIPSTNDRKGIPQEGGRGLVETRKILRSEIFSEIGS